MSAVQVVLLSQTGDPAVFHRALEAHRDALEAHRSGPPDTPAPVADTLLESLIQRVPRGDPLPDAFVIVPYEIVHDTPRPPEQQQALQVLRETLGAS